MARTYVVTGSASGIGLATKSLLEERGGRVIGVDLRGADVISDLGTRPGRESMVAEVTKLTDGRLDGVVAVAGLSIPTAVTARVNFFGTVATLEGLRPLLSRSAAPRAVMVSSVALLFPIDKELSDAFDAGDETQAAHLAELLSGGARGGPIYFSSKRALVHWLRRAAPTPEWAGAGIALNAIAPGMTITPMTAHLRETEESRRAADAAMPQPLNGPAEPIVMARMLAWLASEENSHLCGQVIFVDGGFEAARRGVAPFI
jgi:NAD(P)-dependent dehydrogenase (short-subunit alcohol dehydrogenase family)